MLKVKRQLTNYPAGWTCELIEVRLERYLIGTLALGESLIIAEHIEACFWCAERVAMLRFEAQQAGVTRRPATRRSPPPAARGRRAATKRKRGHGH